MRDAAALYLKSILLSVRGQMQYRFSFLTSSVAQFLVTAVEFLVICALFERFGHLQGWSLPEVAVLYGLANVSFALAETLDYGFDSFHQLVKSGEFDRLLLRPRGTAFQVAASGVHVRVGRLLQGLIVLAYGLSALALTFTPEKVALLILTIAGGAALFFGLKVLQATLAFWTTESIEVVNTVTYGGVETIQYPMPIYEKWFRRFFTVVIPLACVNYFPALALMDRPDPLGTPPAVHWLSPLVGFLFLFLSLRIWRFGVRRYRSTGS
jgi:viologen exporter family transport system permease protein